MRSQDLRFNMSKKEAFVSIVLPTYDERENIGPLLSGIHAELQSMWSFEVIVVDDGSPDGTADVVRSAAAECPSIRLVERPRKLGLGSAVAAGFSIAKGDYWVMMDADLSHRPQDLPILLEALANADIVVGSRYIPGGATQGWPLRRRLMSRAAGMLAQRHLAWTFAMPRPASRLPPRDRGAAAALAATGRVQAASRNSGQSDPGPRD